MWGLLFSLLGTGVSAAGSKKQGKKLKRLAGFNAGVAEQQAQDALDRGREAQDQLRSGVRKLVGSQRAGFAAQGVSLADAGSASEVEADTYAMQQQDLERIRVNAAREAWGFRVQAENYRRGGQAQAQQGTAAAAGTILAGLGEAYTSYNRSQPYR